MARTAHQVIDAQLPLQEQWERTLRARRHVRRASGPPLCAGCRAREARYGFRDDHDDPSMERPRTLCFECFRMEITRRQAVAARMAQGWNAEQEQLPLDDRLRSLDLQRRRAQIRARRALGIRS